MKATEIRALSAQDLNKKLADLKTELFNLRFQHAVNQLDNPLRLVEVKKDIARVKTVLKEKSWRLSKEKGGYPDERKKPEKNQNGHGRFR